MVAFLSQFPFLLSSERKPLDVDPAAADPADGRAGRLRGGAGGGAEEALGAAPGSAAENALAAQPVLLVGKALAVQLFQLAFAGAAGNDSSTIESGVTGCAQALTSSTPRTRAMRGMRSPWTTAEGKKKADYQAGGGLVMPVQGTFARPWGSGEKDDIKGEFD